MILYMYVAPGQGKITSDDKISMLIWSFRYSDHFCGFIMILQIVKELEAENHFWYNDKCHNSKTIFGTSAITL